MQEVRINKKGDSVFSYSFCTWSPGKARKVQERAPSSSTSASCSALTSASNGAFPSPGRANSWVRIREYRELLHAGGQFCLCDCWKRTNSTARPLQTWLLRSPHHMSMFVDGTSTPQNDNDNAGAAGMEPARLRKYFRMKKCCRMFHGKRIKQQMSSLWMYSKLILDQAFREVEEKNCRLGAGHFPGMGSLERWSGIAPLWASCGLRCLRCNWRSWDLGSVWLLINLLLSMKNLVI